MKMYKENFKKINKMNMKILCYFVNSTTKVILEKLFILA